MRDERVDNVDGDQAEFCEPLTRRIAKRNDTLSPYIFKGRGLAPIRML
jgi:hypothetical protein